MNETIFALFFTVFVFSTVGISQTCGKNVKLDQEFSLKADEKAIIKTEAFEIEFLSVAEDSRCPPGVDCIWAGNARVKVSLKKGDQTGKEFELNTTLEPHMIEFEGMKVELVSLSDNPNSAPEGKSSPYSAGFVIRRK